MDAWTYQGIEIRAQEQPQALLDRLGNLEAALGLTVGFQAVGLFEAPMTKSNPPRFSEKGLPRQFLHVTWEREASQAWSVINHVGLFDRRALLSAFTGAGFLARDVDLDGHPRDSALIAAFLTKADDFPAPLRPGAEAEIAQRTSRWREALADAAAHLRGEAVDPERLGEAARWVSGHQVRFEYGWYLKSGPWRSRYLVQSGDHVFSLAVAQESLCTCSSRYPDSLRLVMASDGCAHYLAARLEDDLAQQALGRVGKSASSGR